MQTFIGMWAQTEQRHTPTLSRSYANKDESPPLQQQTSGALTPPLACEWERVVSGGADPEELLTQSAVRRRAMSEPSAQR